MENLPVIMSGPRVVLTPACREDIPEVLRWMTDPELNIFLLDYGKVRTLEQEYTWYDDVVVKAGSHHLVQMAIRLTEDQKLIGYCRVHAAECCAHPAGILQQRTVETPPEVLKDIKEAVGCTSASADATGIHRVQVHVRVEKSRHQRHAGRVDHSSLSNPRRKRS